MIARVALDLPYSYPYDYEIPTQSESDIRIGQRVVVPFNHQEKIGFVVGIQDQSKFSPLKEILHIVDAQAIVDDWLLEFTNWISEYYFSSWGEVLNATIPAGIKPKIEKQLVPGIKIEEKSTLPIKKQQTLEKIIDENLTSLAKIKNDPNLKLFIKDCIKQQILEYKIQLHFPSHSKQVIKWISLNHKQATSYNPKKESKAESIVGELKNNTKIKREELLKKFPNSLNTIRWLKQKQILVEEIENIYHFQNIYNDLHSTPPIEIQKDRFLKLNDEQHKVLQPILDSIQKRIFKVHLLFGITGSGKTEIYLNAVKNTLLEGRNALILVPEISLTPQTVERFKDRFGENVAVMHSGMDNRQRTLEWCNIKQQQCPIVIGARSAIFAPLKNIGLIVVDEEHDSSYKQQETPYYNSRDCAIKLASTINATVILGSATPSIESYRNALIGKYTLLSLPYRISNLNTPSIDIVDLKNQKRQPGVFYLSLYLVQQLKINYTKGLQALLFLNRRGYAAFIACTKCSLPILCNHCSIAMTWHKKSSLLICHHCNDRQRYPTVCKHCKGDKFRLEGIGTERVERDLSILFPKANFIRLDRDTVRKKGDLERKINEINHGKIDFIVGTQMISKGHDFKNIGVVCVVMADISLNIPDFRSSERTFQLISQVSGRAGRGYSGEGKALIQTYNPSHYAIQTANRADFIEFYNYEIELRKTLQNPPFQRLILIKISDINEINAKKTAENLSIKIKALEGTCNFSLRGPIESPIPKIANRYYQQILIQSQEINEVKRLIRELIFTRQTWKQGSSTRITVDIDPANMS